MSKGLKPCPFCGREEAKLTKCRAEWLFGWHVTCNHCLSVGATAYSDRVGVGSKTPEEKERQMKAYAVSNWNRRALSEQSGAANDTADDNPPLTLEELRDLAGKEAVYAVSSADKGHWCVIDTAPRFGGGTAIIAIYGRGLTLGGDDYGTLWLAYRRKPEEETT